MPSHNSHLSVQYYAELHTGSYDIIEPIYFDRKYLKNRMTTKESQIEQRLIDKLEELKYTYRQDIRTQEALENNFRKKFEDLNKVNLTDSEYSRLREQIISADVFAAAKILRETNSFERDDGTPLHYTLVNIKDWCKNIKRYQTLG